MTSTTDSREARRPRIRTQQLIPLTEHRIALGQAYARGCRDGRAADRLWWLVLGFCIGAAIAAVAKYF